MVDGGFAAWVDSESNNEQGFTTAQEDHAIANCRCEVKHPSAAAASWNDGVGDTADGDITSYVRGYLVAYGPVPVSAMPTLACSPDPAPVGATVTCLVARGPQSGDILWRAALEAAFEGAGVTLDATGSGAVHIRRSRRD